MGVGGMAVVGYVSVYSGVRGGREGGSDGGLGEGMMWWLCKVGFGKACNI